MEHQDHKEIVQKKIQYNRTRPDEGFGQTPQHASSMTKPGGISNTNTALKLPADFVKNIVDDIDKWIKSKMWSLSCYGFTMYGPSLPALHDIHPEELRAEAYQHRLSNGQLHTNYRSVFQGQQEEQLQLRNRLLKCLEIADPTDRRHLEEFVASYMRLREEAKAGIQRPAAPNAQSPFANTANRGQGSSSGQTPSLFAPRTNPSVGFSFKAAMQSSAPQSLFNAISTAQPSASQSLFNAAPNTQTCVPQSLFNAASTAQPNVPQSLFNAAPTAQTSAPQSLFRTAASGSASVPPTLFGSAPNSATATSNQPIQSNVSGPMLPPGSLFAPSSKVFNAPSPQQPPQPAGVDDCSYTARQALTPEQLRLFEADEFPFHSVPYVPPPRDLCL